MPDRLKRRSDFLRLAKSGRKWVAPTVIVQADAGPQDALRVGITATKKLGNAVARNRTKRRLRAAVRDATRDKRQGCRQDIVLIGRPDTATCVYATLVRDLKWCLKRLEVMGHAPLADRPA